MTTRLRDESGAATVVVAVVIVVLVGMLALTIDSGLLWTKFRRVRTANDAASLAAALSCAKGDGLAAANAQADAYALANVSDAAAVQPAFYPSGCEPEGGKVTVYYGGNQSLMFGPAIGVSSPRPVAASATAVWGGAGAAMRVAPLMLSMNRLSTCGIPDGEELYDGMPCFFWWDNGTAHDTTALTNAEWGLMDLTTWGIAPYGACTGTVNQSQVGTWITQGFPGTLTVPPAPKYACRGSGFQGNALNNDVNAMAGDLLYFPVNDQTQQVDKDGLLCPPGATVTCTVDKYAIIGFAVLEVVQIWTGQDAQDKCQHPASNNGSIRCLEALWRGFDPVGFTVGGGQNFGVVAVAIES